MVNSRMNIDDLIEIVADGGKVKTGVDVFNSHGVLLLDKNVVVDRTKTLEILKDNGVGSVPLSSSKDSGVWDKSGNPVKMNRESIHEPDESREDEQTAKPPSAGEIEKKLYEIEELKKIAQVKYDEAKTSIRKVLGDIRDSGGAFDYDEVSQSVGEMVEFLTVNDNPFSYLTKEIFTYDDYLYNHSVNVCTIGTAILHRFNTHFSRSFNDFLDSGSRAARSPFEKEPESTDDFVFFQKEEIRDISLGFFLHDLGKVMVSEEILNKNGSLSGVEFDEVKKHTFEYGVGVLEKNRIKNSVLYNIVKYHHAPLFKGEERCYPGEKQAGEIPVYVKICKLADMYDAMTSKRCYKEAFNPINVVTELFRKYARKNRILQFLLHSFVKSIGIYPPGSIVFMRNGQMAYILESTGPLVLPFTDGNQAPLSAKPDPLDISDSRNQESLQIDHRRSVQTPAEVYDMLPSYIKEVVSKSAD